MKLRDNKFIYAGARLIGAAALVVTLAFAPGLVLAADKDAHEDRAEVRINQMHTKLKITSAQEDQWRKVAEAMRDDAKTMDKLTQARVARAKDMTAIDDLKSYGEIAEAHADGVRKLTPVFADLYATMSDPQKKVADQLFRHGDRQKSRHQQGENASEAK